MPQIPVVNIFGGPVTSGSPSNFIGQYIFVAATGSVSATAPGASNVVFRNGTNTPATPGYAGDVTYLLPAASLCGGQIRTLFFAENYDGTARSLAIKDSTGVTTYITLLAETQTNGGAATAANKPIGVTMACDGTNWYVAGTSTKTT